MTPSPGLVDLLSLSPCVVMTKLTSLSFSTPSFESVLSSKLLRHLMTCWLSIVKCVFEDLRKTKAPNRDVIDIIYVVDRNISIGYFIHRWVLGQHK
jgi:hypothetical protein